MAALNMDDQRDFVTRQYANLVAAGLDAEKSGDNVRYVIDRSGKAGHLDTLTIDWNLKDGSSKGILRAPDRAAEEYQATLQGGKVLVKSSDRGSRGPQQVALYAN